MSVAGSQRIVRSLWILSGCLTLANSLLGRSASARMLWRLVGNGGRRVLDRLRAVRRAGASPFVLDEWVLAMMAPLILYGLLWLLADVAQSPEIQATRKAWDAARSSEAERHTVAR